MKRLQPLAPRPISLPATAAALLVTTLVTLGCQSAADRYAEGTTDTQVMLERAWQDVTKATTYVGEIHVATALAEHETALDSTEDRLRLAKSLVRIGETRRGLALYADVLARLDADEVELREQIERSRAVAWLRLAEQENCLAHHNCDSCVYPLVDAALHRDAPEGAREAVAAWAEILARDPDDLHARWLYGLARMALGGAQSESGVGPLVPNVDPAVAALPPLRDIADAVGAGLGVNQASGGCVLDDLDGDGWIDILTSVAIPVDDPDGRLRMFRNLGDGQFEDVSERAGVAGICGGLNLVHADYDNDGDIDVLVLRGAWQMEDGQWPNTLLRNDGSGRFEDVTVAAGLLSFQPTQAACFADYDNDGDLDLFVGNETGVPALEESAIAQFFADFFLGIRDAFSPLIGGHLYRNNGDGTFEDVIDDAGIDLHGWVKGASWGDVDGDGFEDLYVSIWGDPNLLYRNRGDGTFEEVAEEYGVDDHLLSFACWFWDHDNDGDDDLFVCGFPIPDIEFPSGGMPLELDWRADAEIADFLGEARRPQIWNAWPALFENVGEGAFANVTEESGLDATMSIMGANFGDVDGDGYLDVMLGTGAPNMDYLVPNRLFLNRPAESDPTRRRFVDASIPLRFAHLQKGHAIGLADFDHDNDQDVYSVLGGAYPGDIFPNALLVNPGYGGRMITLDLIGGEGTNRGALGSRVRLVVEDADGSRRTITRTVSSGGSFGASSLRLEIGVGAAERLVRADVTWSDADRTVQTVHDASRPTLELDGRYVVRQGLAPQPVSGARFDLAESAAGDEPTARD